MRFQEFSKKINEAFEIKRAKPGEVPFRSSAETDPHIKTFIARLAADTGVDEAEMWKELEKAKGPLDEINKHSPILFATLAKNLVEQAAFNLIKTSKKKFDQTNAQFNIDIFMTLIKMVQYENSGFFPMKAPLEFKRIYQIIPILVPSTAPEYASFKSIDTAAVTANGEFIFNTNFMEQLLYYGEVVGIQGKGVKYVSNGGTIPDNYAYIEFLIIHEILHYVMGDFATGRRFPQYEHRVHNWAQDFRSNYLLVKSGYTQLPLGLFSDDFNLDRDEMRTYEKLIKAVYTEMQKIPKQYQAWIEEKFESDAHENPDDGDQPEWQPEIGDIVIHNKEGTFGKITKILPTGEYETAPVDLKEVEQLHPGIKVR